MNIIAPCPQKPSLYSHKDEDLDEACQELRQILTSPYTYDPFSIVRTNNPMPHDTSFVPTSFNIQQEEYIANPHRPRSFSAGDSTKYPLLKVISLVH
jgi:hypothetical protein